MTDRDRHTERHTDREEGTRERETDRQTYRQTERGGGGLQDGRTDRQTRFTT